MSPCHRPPSTGRSATASPRFPIEERSGDEVTSVWGRLDDGGLGTVRICPEATRGGNPAFDVTPARLVTGLITERGVCAASAEGLSALFPERRSA